MKKRILDDCLRLARILVHKHKEHFQHYSFVIQKNVIVEWGTNKSADPIIFLGYNAHQKLHSEYLSYRAARGLLDKNEPFEIVNVRLGKKNELKISKPCPICQAWLVAVNCSHIWYTTTSGTFEKI